MPGPPDIRRQALTVDRSARRALLAQRPAVLWFTGLSGAGKSTIADRVETQLHGAGYLTLLLDGDNLRHGLCSDLGFSDADRDENIRRVTEVAKLVVETGLIVLVSFISPFRAQRERARASFAAGEFFEVHVDAPLAVVEQRDPKGLYAKARAGELKDFTGIDSPYEPPLAPEVHLRTAEISPDAAADTVIAALHAAGRLDRPTPSVHAAGFPPDGA